eukprot:Skav203866  [mRNA]  locus=scaffold1031:114344:143736:- [translate_table: standard]
MGSAGSGDLAAKSKVCAVVFDFHNDNMQKAFVAWPLGHQSHGTELFHHGHPWFSWRQQRFLAVVVVLSCLTIGVTYLVASGIQMMLQARRLRKALKNQLLSQNQVLSAQLHEKEKNLEVLSAVKARLAKELQQANDFLDQTSRENQLLETSAPSPWTNTGEACGQSARTWRAKLCDLRRSLQARKIA